MACDPRGFSESFVGWQAVKTLATLTQHEFWVITSPASRENILQSQELGDIPENVHFEFHGELTSYHPNRLYARLQSWRNYQRWTSTLLKRGQLLHQKIGFDLVHHITYVTWRVACPLWKMDIPLIWGPVGGGEVFPKGLLSVLSPQARIFEGLRNLSNHISAHSPAVRACATNAAHVFSANTDTTDLLIRLKVKPERMSTLSATFFEPSGMARFGVVPRTDVQPARLELFAGGNLEGRKGVAMALRALALTSKRNREFRFHYTIGGNGPELMFLKNLSRELEIENSVEFTNGFSGDAYVNRLTASHVYLLPSLRDNAPVTLMEAMLSGCVPIVADCGGPREIVTDECGYRVQPHTPESMVNEIADILDELSGHPKLLTLKGNAAQQRIRTKYTSAAWLQEVESVYFKLMAVN